MTISIHHGDCLELLPKLPENSIDACVTDPPYHLVSIHKRFSKSGGADRQPGTDQYDRLSRGFMGKAWDGGDVAFRVETWEAVFRVLKPGAHLIAFGGTRTYHRMVCAIEDAGFEIRDQIGWLYGSGFPKSHSVEKKLDTRSDEEIEAGDPQAPDAMRWQGWGTALKPAWEPVVLARKPLIGRVVDNVLAHGTGALNIDACRLEPADGDYNYAPGEHGIEGRTRQSWFALSAGKRHEDGRWPANVIHDGSAEVIAAFPDTPGQQRDVTGKEQSHVTKNTYGHFERGGDGMEARGDLGSAARFFYQAKADKGDRLASKHPTVKPVDLIAYLCRMVTPPGGVILDPFAGSGTTGMACLREGFHAILMEREAEYVADIKRRIAHVHGEDTPLFGGAAP
jgi:site-specific DNA-methyltransferase (adenine-specific)